jgi:hypothetical protein
VTLKINWHELRILTIWADNWAREKCPPHSQRTLASILKNLESQRPTEGRFAPLTVLGEIREIQDMGYDAEAVASDGTVLVPRKIKN